MASATQCLASLARLSLSSAARPPAASIPRFLVPSVAASQARFASGGAGGLRKREKKKKAYKSFRSYDKSDLTQYSLCDAIRYIRAYEVGRPPTSVKYDLALKLRTIKSGPVVRNRIRLPHPVKTDTRIAVVCPDNSNLAAEVRSLGAVVAGQESLFESIRQGNIQFNQLICHADSESALKKANLGKILGPKGLMPSLKTKTITNNVKGLMRELVGADEYRERNGVVRLPIGQLGFTPDMLADNVKAFMRSVKSDITELEDHLDKQIDEVVFSSTNGPGFSLNGAFNPTDDKIQPSHLQGPM